MQILRASLTEKEAELEAARKSQKSSHLMELLSEKEEYYLEVRKMIYFYLIFPIHLYDAGSKIATNSS